MFVADREPSVETIPGPGWRRTALEAEIGLALSHVAATGDLARPSRG